MWQPVSTTAPSARHRPSRWQRRTVCWSLNTCLLRTQLVPCLPAHLGLRLERDALRVAARQHDSAQHRRGGALLAGQRTAVQHGQLTMCPAAHLGLQLQQHALRVAAGQHDGAEPRSVDQPGGGGALLAGRRAAEAAARRALVAGQAAVTGVSVAACANGVQALAGRGMGPAVGALALWLGLRE